MVVKTLLEKLDTSCSDLSLRESVCNQVQRIISTRMYLGAKPTLNTWVTGFGVPEVVSEYANPGDQHAAYRALIRKKILEFEPRLIDVHVKSLKSYSDRSSCELVLTLEEGDVEEQFFF